MSEKLAALITKIRTNISDAEFGGIIIMVLIVITPEFFLKLFLCGALCYLMGRKRWSK